MVRLVGCGESWCAQYKEKEGQDKRYRKTLSLSMAMAMAAARPFLHRRPI
jgi:hypothetical protein